jgi:hypothetical protein
MAALDSREPFDSGLIGAGDGFPGPMLEREILVLSR